jgi:hypothetical protein
MMQDQFVGANRYEHHNFKAVANQNSMSLLRNNTTCFVNSPLLSTVISATQPTVAYTQTPVINVVAYGLVANPVTGIFVNCVGGGSGAFRTTGGQGEFGNEELIADGSFKLYPTLLRGNALINAQFSVDEDAAVTIRVYNLQSQLMLNRTGKAVRGQNTLGIDLSALRSGTYVVELDAAGKVWRNKIVKE